MRTPITLSRSPRGHYAHAPKATADGLPGTIHRPIKLTFLGAGSSFTPRLVNDIMRIPGNRGGIVALVDIDPKRLKIAARLVEKLFCDFGETEWRVTTTTDRRRALPGSHYVVNCIEVSGLKCVRLENDIPKKYGVDQCIGDTIGPGGLFKALRTIPVWLDMLKDCERLCPRAIILNYTNPMAMLCLAAHRTSSMRVVGLCHSVQNTSQLLARYAGIPYGEMEWECAGINHLAWFTKLSHRGQSLYPQLRRKFAAEVAIGIREFDFGLARQDSGDDSHGSIAEVQYKQKDLVRKDMCLHFGGFITESSGHLSEYLPFYRSNENGRKLLRLAYDGGSLFYATNWPRWRADADAERRALLRSRCLPEWPRTGEYASWIIEAREKNVPYNFHGNVANSATGGDPLISNLPADGCVEVACCVDRSGIKPRKFGALPSQMAAISASNMPMFELGVQAAIERSVEKAIYALMLDPLTAAVCSPRQINSMVLELFKEEKAYLADYR